MRFTLVNFTPRELNQWLCYLWGSIALDVKMKKKNTLSPLEAKVRYFLCIMTFNSTVDLV